MEREELRTKLTTAITNQLNDLASANHCGAGTLVKRINRSEVRVRLASVDRLACEVELVSVTDPKLGSLPVEMLQELADRIASEILYLEERLVVLEVDSMASLVQLRSATPHVESDSKSYFEVHVGKMGVTLRRFSKTPESRRKQVPGTFTRDVLNRLCVDLLHAVIATPTGR